MTQWSQEHEATLRLCHAKGLTNAEIALHMREDFSKDAIINKLHKLGLLRRKQRRLSAPVPLAASCEWPCGQPGEESFRLCGQAPLHPGSSYCAKHHRLAYIGFYDVDFSCDESTT